MGPHRKSADIPINPECGPVQSNSDAVHIAIYSLLLPVLSVAANRPPRVLLGFQVEACFTALSGTVGISPQSWFFVCVYCKKD